MLVPCHPTGKRRDRQQYPVDPNGQVVVAPQQKPTVEGFRDLELGEQESESATLVVEIEIDLGSATAEMFPAQLDESVSGSLANAVVPPSPVDTNALVEGGEMPRNGRIYRGIDEPEGGAVEMLQGEGFSPSPIIGVVILDGTEDEKVGYKSAPREVEVFSRSVRGLPQQDQSKKDN